ncbi:hypothetical protein GUITHDRAFT_67122 [Guillardia theta CCMP2712]|uniref:Alpha-galactosidase n=1 Tax=Guillardia theta (strain CCMP2712) TaxID=905079 RepID=L1JNF3_GUITC|nr:hypothetical protein GUITHDRAFT_67122 [Guillardia theta CCMP2712]EKX50121.1 hypothetical protein GUITHDRAFT_67122 [Guillardia theta CCMP2712]|eukprot:XP_005837101.1 hypothetical protein GUITHDRAFT_67122 [Guillardia theta CCMP2712]
MLWSDGDTFESYLKAVGEHCRARVPADCEQDGGDLSACELGPGMPTGWCSWYEYMEKVSEQDLELNARKLHGWLKQGVDLRVLQLDDGYVDHWGDWTKSSKKFPEGAGNVASIAGRYGLAGGLWIAPWAADKDALVAKEHPEWVLRADSAANSGFTHPGKWFYGLDATNPECRAHVKSFIQEFVQQHGIKFLKLDFLHAAALPALHFDPALTRAQVFQLALQTLREAVGDAFFLACSCPMGAAVGWVDAMRVSADTNLSWKPAQWPIWWDKTNLPSGRNMMRNSLVRHPMHGVWWMNNPDCLVLARCFSLCLPSDPQSVSLRAGMTGGLLFLSDDLLSLPVERLRILQCLFPPLHSQPRSLVLPAHVIFHGQSECPEVLVSEVCWSSAGG